MVEDHAFSMEAVPIKLVEAYKALAAAVKVLLLVYFVAILLKITLVEDTTMCHHSLAVEARAHLLEVELEVFR